MRPLPKATLLRPSHFNELESQLTERGVGYSSNINHYDRVSEVLYAAYDEVKTEGALDRIRDLRSHSKVVLNPYRPSAKTLCSLLQASQDAEVPGEMISIKYGLPTDKNKRVKSYERAWEAEQCDGDSCEGQHLVFVAYDPVQPVGYLGMKVSLIRERAEKWVFVSFSLAMVYVLPNRRGQGFGIDLSIGAGAVAADILEATYRAVPSGTRISSNVSADYESEGGENVTHQVLSALAFKAEVLDDLNSRPSVILDKPQLDAGY